MYEVFSFCNDFVKLVIDGEIQKVLRSEVVLMQATGLKDRNDKLIYESDVLRRHDLSPQQIEDEGDLEFVEWCSGGFNITFADAVCCEIIGNRFKNPELLNNF
jgi:uncharacterized phage protein (TIGR01671 family)